MSFFGSYESSDEIFEDWEDVDEDTDEDTDEDADEDDGESFLSERRGRRANPVKQRPPLQVSNAQVSPTGGIRNATLNTPKGSAQIALPASVPTRAEFTAAIKQVNSAIAKNTNRINTLQSDITKVGQSVSAVDKRVSDLGTGVDKLRKQQKVAAEKTKKAIAKLRKEQAAAAQNSMLITLMMSMQAQKTFAEHTHGTDGKVVGASTSDSSSMLLPLLLMGGLGGGDSKDGGGNMMMLVLLMTMMQ